MHGGMCKFCTYHFSLKFAFLENVGDMLCDYGSLASEQPTHLLLCQPDGLAVRLNLEADVVRRLVNHDLLVHVSLLSLRWVHYLIFMSSYR